MAYQYLRQFKPGGSGDNDNWFMSISFEEIEGAEREMGITFPPQLREFYTEIGFGMLRSPILPPKGYEFYSANEILPPRVVARFAKAIIDHRKTPFEEPIEYEDHWINHDALDLLMPGDLPFFEIADSYRFLVMRPLSENANAIWTSSGMKIEDSFERFIWRLYHEDPGYYDDLIEDHYGLPDHD
ncbi:MAG: SMI1/KNR4 family protein [Alphaproteobacteria bacterium]|nr:MAG: SMI1/KNR4 family protein [Alphaproteobacteria bacterium]